MNAEKRWTHGPWEFIPAGNKPVVQMKGPFPYGFICNVESQNFIPDAHLISAAPELYDALEDCLVALSQAGAHGELKVARAALSKARGEK